MVEKSSIRVEILRVDIGDNGSSVKTGYHVENLIDLGVAEKIEICGEYCAAEADGEKRLFHSFSVL